jgi:hypothetical protein
MMSYLRAVDRQIFGLFLQAIRLRGPLGLWLVVAVAAIAGFVVLPASAAWINNGVPVCTSAYTQQQMQAISDGAGGIIMVWRDERTGTNYDIYAQRIDGRGFPLWTAEGVAVCTAVNTQENPQVISDMAGGVIVVWQDLRGGTTDIYAQRLDGSGTPLWSANGVGICTAPNTQQYPQMASDGAGGAIIAWQDDRGGSQDIYARRVDVSGLALWTLDGVAISTAAASQVAPQLVSDDAGGAIITWKDSRSGADDIYAQRVNGTGVVQWAADAAVCTATGAQSEHQIVRDGHGGGIIVWQDGRSTYDIYVQRISSGGAPIWMANGVAVCADSYEQTKPQVISDSSDGVIIAWQDNRTYDWNIYARRVNASGTPMWTANGVAICTYSNYQESPQLVPDGDGGAVVVWQDNRTGSYYDIYAQRVNSVGTTLWTNNGVSVCNLNYHQQNPRIVSDDMNGAIIAWQDYRSFSNDDQYVQRVEAVFGSWGRPEPTTVSAEDNPGDQGGVVALDWLASDHDIRYYNEITYYSIWRATDAMSLAVSSASAFDGIPIVTASDVGPDFTGPAVRVERIAGTTYYWEWVVNQNARSAAGYSYLTPTRHDAMEGVPGVHYFQVLSHTSDQYKFWESNVVSGYSIDNLAPAPPLVLTAERIGRQVLLAWRPSGENEGDFRDYTIYRSTSPGVPPTPIFFFSSSGDTNTVDPSPPIGTGYYIVTAVDVHGNQSAPSNEAETESGITGVWDGRATPAQLTVLGNAPNPFAGTTKFVVGLPRASDVTVDVFDVAGRRVGRRTFSDVALGWQTLTFDGRASDGRSLASGVYFYRVTAGAETQTRKMVIQR